MEKKMVNIWFCREGKHPTPSGKPAAIIDEDTAAKLMEQNSKYLGISPPEFESKNPEIDGIREPKFVVLETFETTKDYKKGFYILLDTTISEVKRTLKIP
jgi:hypothetical protein